MADNKTIVNGNVGNFAVAHEQKTEKRTLSELIKDFAPVINLLASIINLFSRLV